MDSVLTVGDVILNIRHECFAEAERDVINHANRLGNPLGLTEDYMINVLYERNCKDRGVTP